MRYLKSWKEVMVMKGYYTCPATEFSHYEIMVTYHAEGTPWLTSKGNLYLVGDYFNYPGSDSKHFERELLMSGNSVQNLIEYATEHYAGLHASACASDGVDMQERRTDDNS